MSRNVHGIGASQVRDDTTKVQQSRKRSRCSLPHPVAQERARLAPKERLGVRAVALRE